MQPGVPGGPPGRTTLQLDWAQGLVRYTAPTTVAGMSPHEPGKPAAVSAWRGGM